MKEKRIQKMIRHILHALLMLFINSIIFIFKKINVVFKFFKGKTTKFNKSFSSFLEDHKRSVKEGLIALLICVVGDLFAGIILGNMTFFLEKYLGLLVLIPGAIGMRGNIFGSFGSRLSSNLHIGIITPEFKRSETLTNNILSSLALTLILSSFLAIISKGICLLFGFKSMGLTDFILISIVAGLISSIIMLPITMFISLKSFENGWDPDNVTTPIICAFGDLFTLPAIILALFILTLLNVVIIVKYIVLIFLIILIISAFYYGLKLSDESKTILKQSAPVLLVCSLLGSFAGGVFNSSLETLLTDSSLLTLLPLFSGESGSLISILGARLSSGLHSGLIEPVLRPKKNTIYNFLITVILAIIVYPLIGFVSDTSTNALGQTGLGYAKIISISTISGFILVPIMMIIVFYISTISYRKGLDPDNIVIPISTSITDSISSLILVTVSLIITGAVVLV